MRRLFLVLLVPMVLCAKEKMQVRIISATDTESTYTVGSAGSQSTTCSGTQYSGILTANCTGRTLPAIVREFNVQGHVFYLELPDKRVVVVSCDAKPNFTDWHQGAYRDCRAPVAGTIDAEFSGDKAKLSWPVSLDGKKRLSETYQIVGILTPTK